LSDFMEFIPIKESILQSGKWYFNNDKQLYRYRLIYFVEVKSQAIDENTLFK